MLSVAPMNFSDRRPAPLALPQAGIQNRNMPSHVLPAPNLPPIFPQAHPYTIQYPPVSPTECTPRNVPVAVPMFGPAFGPRLASQFAGAPDFPVMQPKGAPVSVLYRGPGDAAGYYTCYPPASGAGTSISAGTPVSAPALPMVSPGHNSPTMHLAFVPDAQQVPTYVAPSYYRSPDGPNFPVQPPLMLHLADNKPVHHPTHSCPASLGSITPPMSTQSVRGFVEVKPFQRNEMKMKTRKLFRCDQCGKEYTRRHNMLVHKFSAHSSEKRFECHVCHSKFKRKSDYIRHNKEQHTNSVKRFVCEGELTDGTKWGCGKRFFRKDQLKKHLNANRAQYTCLKNVPSGKPASIDGITVTKASSSAGRSAQPEPAPLAKLPLSA